MPFKLEIKYFKNLNYIIFFMFEGTRPHPVRAHPHGGDGVQGGGGDSGDSAAHQAR